MPGNLQFVTSAPWRDGSPAQAAVSVPWRDGASLQSLGSPYTPPSSGGTGSQIGSLAAAKRIDARGVYESNHTLQVIDMRTGLALPVTSVDMALTDGSAFWTLRAAAAFEAKAALEAGEQPAQVEVQINGQTWRFVVESIDTPRAFASSAISFGGRSLAALADAPYQLPQQWIADAPTTAAQIATLAQTYSGLEVLWQAPDWLVPAGGWTHQGSPFSVISQVATAIGGVVEASRDTFAVYVRSRYPVMPNEWAGTPPDVQVAWNAVESESVQRVDQPDYTSIVVAGPDGVANVRLEGTAGADAAPMVTDPLLTEHGARVERATSALAAAGGASMVSRTLQVLSGTDEPGVIERGALVRWVDPDETWSGMVRSVSVLASLVAVRQTIVCERRTSFPLGTSEPPAVSAPPPPPPPPPPAVPLTDVIDHTDNAAQGTYFVPTDAEAFDPPYYRAHGEDWSWQHNPISGTVESIVLQVGAYDVDNPAEGYPESDWEIDAIDAYNVGTSSWVNLGNLSGVDSTWTLTSFTLDPATWLASVQAGLQVRVRLDLNMYGWYLTLSKSALQINGGSTVSPAP